MNLYPIIYGWSGVLPGPRRSGDDDGRASTDSERRKKTERNNSWTQQGTEPEEIKTVFQLLQTRCFIRVFLFCWPLSRWGCWGTIQSQHRNLLTLAFISMEALLAWYLILLIFTNKKKRRRRKKIRKKKRRNKRVSLQQKRVLSKINFAQNLNLLRWGDFFSFLREVKRILRATFIVLLSSSLNRKHSTAQPLQHDRNSTRAQANPPTVYIYAVYNLCMCDVCN